MARNYSKQNDAIRTYLAGRTDHPAAEQIIAAVREKLPDVSRGTVYRNLGNMVEDGELTKVDCGDGHEHYDPRTDVHAHFICTECGCVIDVESVDPKRTMRRAAEEIGAEVQSVTTVYRGICQRCVKKSKKHSK